MVPVLKYILPEGLTLEKCLPTLQVDNLAIPIALHDNHIRIYIHIVMDEHISWQEVVLLYMVITIIQVSQIYLEWVSVAGCERQFSALIEGKGPWSGISSMTFQVYTIC
jgi:hypothetical protein